MKKLTYFILLMGGLLQQAHAQKKYAWLAGKKVVFNEVPGKFLITFQPTVTRETMTRLIAAAYGKRNKTFAPEIISHSAVYHIDKNGNDEITSWKNNPEIKIVTPFLTTEKGSEAAATDEFFVKLKQSSDLAFFQEMCRERNVVVIKKDAYTTDLFLLRCPAGRNAMDEANAWWESKRYAYCEPNFLVLMKDMNRRKPVASPSVSNASRTTNDPSLFNQWSVENNGEFNTGSGTTYTYLTPGCDMRVKKAWDIATGVPTVKIAIIDNGVDLTHPDLVNNLVAGYDATDGNGGCGFNGGFCNGVLSVDFHGTACAGIAAASGNNGIGIAGVAHGAKIMPVRIAVSTPFDNFYTTNAWCADGINWAWANGAAVLSNSWGGGAASSVINDAIQSAVSFGRSGLGSVVLFSAGNDNSTVSYPASNANVIAVGAMSPCNQRKSPNSCDTLFTDETWGSNYGTNLDVAAPGVFIHTTDITGSPGYTTADYMADFNGTSAACPNAAGVAVLIISAAEPFTSGATIRNILEQTCRKVVPNSGPAYIYNSNVAGQPNGTWSNDLGYGMVNAYAAVLKAIDNGCSPDWNITSPLSTNEQYEATNTITGTSVINTNNTVIFDAGNRVSLKPGFKATSGARFIARIDGCGGSLP